MKHGIGGRSSEEMAKYRDIVNVSLTRGSSDWPDLRALDLSLHAAHRLQPSIGMCHTTEAFRVNQVDAHPKQFARDDIAGQRKNTSWNERARQEAE